MHTTYVFGDIGGHADLYRDALLSIGVDPVTGQIRENVTVVQLGDLIDRGPDSDGVVDMVERLVESPRYIQLVGNHETNHLGGPQFFERGAVGHTLPSQESIQILKQLWHEGILRLAYAVGDTLITHSGMTSWLWERLGEPATASEAADLINDNPEMCMQAGIMLDGGALDAGVQWASVWPELYGSWLGMDMPFDQVHGHSSAYSWNRKRFNIPEDLEFRVKLNPNDRHVFYNTAHPNMSIMKCIIGIDPGLGQYSNFTPVPLALQT